MAKHKTKKSKILRLALIAFLIYVAVSFVVMQLDISRRRQDLQTIQQTLSEQQYLNKEMQTIIDSGTDTEYIMRMAREKLGFVFPDEKVFIDPNRKQ